MNNECVKCGQHRKAIKRHHMICGSVDSQTGELDQEWGRHRYRPYSEKELEAFDKMFKIYEAQDLAFQKSLESRNTQDA